MNNFTELSLSPRLQENLVRNAFRVPTPVQAQSIPPAMSGRDVVATANTGTGKTLAFLIPMMDRLMRGKPNANPKLTVRSLILTPTRELALQIAESFQLLAQGTGLTAAVAVGGLNEQKQLLAIRKGAQVLIATPGRLSDFLNRNLVRLGAAEVLVLDEADRMLDMGFLPVITAIIAELPAKRQTLLFSATIEKSVAHLVNNHVTDPVRVAVGSPSKPTENVELHVYEVESEKKLPLLHKMLTSEKGSFLVFARTKHGADRLALRLAGAGVKAIAIHGNRTQNQRNQALKGFQDGYYRVLVATDVAARGIHVDGIAHVVNFDLPQVPEDFIHRVGRAGRAGAKGIASLFGTRSERGDVLRIEKALRIKLQPQRIDQALLLSLPDGETDRTPHRSAGRGHQAQAHRGVRGPGKQRNARGERRPHEQPVRMGGTRADARV